NERGHMVERAYFDLEGQPAAPTGGAHRSRYRPDGKGRNLEEAEVGGGGELLRRTLYRYDAHGRMLETLTLGPNGRPRHRRAGTTNLGARRVFVHDEAGKVKEFETWRADPEGRLTLWRRSDARSRVLAYAYLDRPGKPILDPEREYHRVVFRHDEGGRVVD